MSVSHTCFLQQPGGGSYRCLACEDIVGRSAIMDYKTGDREATRTALERLISGQLQQVTSPFIVKDSGARQSFAGGMVRDITEGKIDYHRIADGPMAKRWADHLTKAKAKYADVEPGKANWLLAAGEEEHQRFRQSAFRHFMQWFLGDRDEDHAAAVFFNINGAEYVRERLENGEKEEAA